MNCLCSNKQTDKQTVFGYCFDSIDWQSINRGDNAPPEPWASTHWIDRCLGNSFLSFSRELFIPLSIGNIQFQLIGQDTPPQFALIIAKLIDIASLRLIPIIHHHQPCWLGEIDAPLPFDWFAFDWPRVNGKWFDGQDRPINWPMVVVVIKWKHSVEQYVSTRVLSTLSRGTHTAPDTWFPFHHRWWMRPQVIDLGQQSRWPSTLVHEVYFWLFLMHKEPNVLSANQAQKDSSKCGQAEQC